MGDCIEKVGFIAKYNNVEELFRNEITPLATTLAQLSQASYNFSESAAAIASINFTEHHQINELLDLVYDIRRLSEEVFEITEQRTEVAIRAVESGVYDVKNIVNTVAQVTQCNPTTSTTSTAQVVETEKTAHTKKIAQTSKPEQ